MDKIKKLLKTVLEAAQEVKAEDIVGLDLTDVESYADYVVIASGQNDRQIQALSHRITKKVFEEHKRHPLGVEGANTSEWILIDYGDLICHVFAPEVREIYHLEDMWPQLSPLNEEQLQKLITIPPRRSKSAASAPVKKRAKT